MTSLAFLATCTADELAGPVVYANRRWYASSNVAWTLVANGFITLPARVAVGSAAGVTTTDMSRPPETRTGAMSVGKCRWCDGGKGVGGGQIASARTSCEWRRREQDWTHRPGARETRGDGFVEPRDVFT